MIDGSTDRWLRVLVAVADAGSFTGAARRLGVGQPAVSHAIKQLERSLGTRLLDRHRAGTRPTDAGARLVEQVRGPLGAIDLAVREVVPPTDPDLVVLAVSTPLASHWLMPRLRRFRLAHPDVRLRVLTSDADPERGADDADLWIPLGWGNWPDRDVRVFSEERVYPVAAPGRVDDDTDPVDLLHRHLLDHEERYRARFDWDRWLRAVGVDPTRGPGARTVFNDYFLVVEAAIAGEGVALGWHHIVDPLVTDGRLERVGTSEVVSDHPFVLVGPTDPRPAVRALGEWLLAEAGAAGQPISSGISALRDEM